MNLGVQCVCTRTHKFVVPSLHEWIYNVPWNLLTLKAPIHPHVLIFFSFFKIYGKPDSIFTNTQRAAYHCIKKMKIDCYNSAWLARRTPNPPTRYYMKVRPGWTNNT
jgi:hypothetical protein